MTVFMDMGWLCMLPFMVAEKRKTNLLYIFEFTNLQKHIYNCQHFYQSEPFLHTHKKMERTPCVNHTVSPGVE